MKSIKCRYLNNAELTDRKKPILFREMDSQNHPCLYDACPFLRTMYNLTAALS